MTILNTPQIPSIRPAERGFSAVRFTLRAAIAVMALALALPVHAADQRAIKSRVPPAYPELAKRMKISGVVKVTATVSPDGSVTEAKATSGNKMLAPAAEDAVRKWKFVPGTEQSIVEVEVGFALAD